MVTYLMDNRIPGNKDKQNTCFYPYFRADNGKETGWLDLLL